MTPLPAMDSDVQVFHARTHFLDARLSRPVEVGALLLSAVQIVPTELYGDISLRLIRILPAAVGPVTSYIVTVAARAPVDRRDMTSRGCRYEFEAPASKNDKR